MSSPPQKVQHDCCLLDEPTVASTPSTTPTTPIEYSTPAETDMPSTPKSKLSTLMGFSMRNDDLQDHKGKYDNSLDISDDDDEEDSTMTPPPPLRKGQLCIPNLPRYFIDQDKFMEIYRQVHPPELEPLYTSSDDCCLPVTSLGMPLDCNYNNKNDNDSFYPKDFTQLAVTAVIENSRLTIKHKPDHKQADPNPISMLLKPEDGHITKRTSPQRTKSPFQASPIHESVSQLSVKLKQRLKHAVPRRNYSAAPARLTKMLTTSDNNVACNSFYKPSKVVNAITNPSTKPPHPSESLQHPSHLNKPTIAPQDQLASAAWPARQKLNTKLLSRTAQNTAVPKTAKTRGSTSNRVSHLSTSPSTRSSIGSDANESCSSSEPTYRRLDDAAAAQIKVLFPAERFETTVKKAGRLALKKQQVRDHNSFQTRRRLNKFQASQTPSRFGLQPLDQYILTTPNEDEPLRILSSDLEVSDVELLDKWESSCCSSSSEDESDLEPESNDSHVLDVSNQTFHIPLPGISSITESIAPGNQSTPRPVFADIMTPPRSSYSAPAPLHPLIKIRHTSSSSVESVFSNESACSTDCSSTHEPSYRSALSTPSFPITLYYTPMSAKSDALFGDQPYIKRDPIDKSSSRKYSKPNRSINKQQRYSASSPLASTPVSATPIKAEMEYSAHIKQEVGDTSFFSTQHHDDESSFIKTLGTPCPKGKSVESGRSNAVDMKNQEMSAIQGLMMMMSRN